MNDLPLTEPLSLSALLDEALKQTRRHFRAIFWPAALPLALVGAVAPLFQPLWIGAAIIDDQSSPSAAIGGMLIIWGVALAFMFLYSVGYAALQVGTVAAVAGRPVSMARAWALACKPAVLGTLLMSWLAFALGLTCCVLPGVYVGLLLALIVPVMAEEGRFGPRAFRRSYELLTYNPRRDWSSDPRVKAFLVLMAGTLLGYGLSFLVQMPLLVLQQVTMFRSLAAGQPLDGEQLLARLVWLQIPTAFCAALVQMGVYLYMGFGLTLLYFDLRRRKEGMDLEAAVEHLAQRGPAGTAN